MREGDVQEITKIGRTTCRLLHEKTKKKYIKSSNSTYTHTRVSVHTHTHRNKRYTSYCKYYWCWYRLRARYVYMTMVVHGTVLTYTFTGTCRWTVRIPSFPRTLGTFHSARTTHRCSRDENDDRTPAASSGYRVCTLRNTSDTYPHLPGTPN